MGRRNENQRNWAHVWILAYKIAVLSQSWKMTGNISATTITSKGIKPDSHWTIWAKEPAADNLSRGASSGTNQNFGKPDKWRQSARQKKWLLLGMYRTRTHSFLCDICCRKYLQTIRNYFFFFLKAYLPLLTEQEKLEVCRTSISKLRIT